MCKPHPSVSGKLLEVLEASWKDVAAGRVVCGTDRVDLPGLVSSPFGFVPKLLPDRTVSSEGRPIWDGTEVNVFSPKEEHPMVVTPEIIAACLRIVVLQVLWPLILVLLSKSDIDGAFKRIWLALSDIDLFATDLPCKEVLEAAWAEVSSSQAAELVEEMAALCPDLRELSLKDAWHTMLACSL